VNIVGWYVGLGESVGFVVVGELGAGTLLGPLQIVGDTLSLFDPPLAMAHS